MPSDPSTHQIGTVPQANSPASRTPPVVETDSPEFFSPNCHRELSRYTRTNTPSGTLPSTSCASPLISSSGCLSVNSSKLSQSLYSNSSSEYLELPPNQEYMDKPPYKKKRRRPRYQTHQRCQDKNKKREQQDQSRLWSQECLTTPTASETLKELYQGQANYDMPRTSSGIRRCTFGKLMLISKGTTVAPTVSTRWSSVEIGAHEVVLDSKLPARTSPSQRLSGSVQEDQLALRPLDQDHRSSMFTLGAIDHNLIHTVHEILTLHKLPLSQSSAPLETPASITLRRASGGNARSRLIDTALPDDSHETQDVRARLFFQDGNSNNRHGSAAYLITSRDVETITDLIEADVKRRHEEGNTYNEITSGINLPVNQTKESCAVSRKTSGKEAGKPEACVPMCTTAMAPGFPEVLPTSPERKKRAASKRSVHEVLWKVGISPSSEPSECSSSTDSCSEYHTPPEYVSQKDYIQTKYRGSNYKGNAFDPDNPQHSIEEWSFRCPSNDVSLEMTSPKPESDIESAGSNPPTKPKNPSIPARPLLRTAISSPKVRTIPEVKVFPRYASVETKLQDVVSFPALPPRKTTNDWYSPLPDMEVSFQTTPLSLTVIPSLHDLGLDANYGPSTSKTTTPKASKGFPVYSATNAPIQQVDFKTVFGEGAGSSPDLQEVRRESVIQSHPNAPPRLGERSSIGSSVGASTHMRRKISAPHIKKACTFDNVHKLEPAVACSKWRRPSVYPLPKTPSPSELNATREGWVAGTDRSFQRLIKLKVGLVNRLTVLDAKTVPLTKVESCTRISGHITAGKVATETLLESCLKHTDEPGESHVCDDCANMSM